MRQRGTAAKEPGLALHSLFPPPVPTSRVCSHPARTEGSEQDAALVAVAPVGGGAGEEAEVFRADTADHQGPVRLLPVPGEQSQSVPQPGVGQGGTAASTDEPKASCTTLCYR